MIIILLFVHQSCPCFLCTSFSPARPSLLLPAHDHNSSRAAIQRAPPTPRRPTTSWRAAGRARDDDDDDGSRVHYNNNNNNIIISYTTIRYPHRVYIISFAKLYVSIANAHSGDPSFRSAGRRSVCLLLTAATPPFYSDIYLDRLDYNIIIIIRASKKINFVYFQFWAFYLNTHFPVLIRV